MPTKRLIRSTTVLSVRRDGKVVLAGDGQVTLGESVIKHSAKKIRRLYNDKILAGFAGSTADAFTLFSRFEAKLEQYHGNLGRAAVELAKDWRTDKFLRHLEALLLVSDKEQTFLLSGQGDVIEPDGRHRGHRQRRPVRPGRRAGARGAHRTLGPPDRRRSHEDCRQNVHLYQRPGDDRRAVRSVVSGQGSVISRYKTDSDLTTGY